MTGRKRASLARWPGCPSRTALKRALRRVTGCDIQHNGWPCDTCFNTHPLANDSDWTAILAYRGDYESSRVGPDYRMATGIVFDATGAFVRHEFQVFPVALLAAHIRALYARLEAPDAPLP